MIISKTIEVDEQESKPPETSEEVEDEVLQACQFLINALSSQGFDKGVLIALWLSFKKYIHSTYVWSA